MVSSLLNLRKRALTSPVSPPPSPLASSNSARPNPALSRLSRLGGGLSSRRKVDSLLSPTTMTDSAEDNDDPFSSPVSSRSLGASLRPLKQIRRQSRSFSSAFTALFPPSSPSPSTPASGTATPQSSRSPASPLAPFNSVRPRLTSEKKKKTGGRRGKRDDGIKRRISYPLLSRASCDQPDRVVVRESWGTRDETQKAPTPCTLGHLAPLPITSNYESCMDQSGSPVVPEWTTMTTTTTTFVPQVPARASLATSTQAVHHDAHPGDLAGNEDTASRFSASTAEESIYSTAVTDSSATWVKFPSTMTVSAIAEAPSIVHFAGLAGDESTDLAYSPSLVLDVQSSGEHGDEILTAPSSPDFRCESPTTTTKIFAPASAPATLAWTSKDSRTENVLQSTATPKRQRHPHRLLTPPPTPHLVPVGSRLHTPEDLEISPPKYTGLVSSTAAHAHDDAPGGGSTRDSLLSLTLAELSDEMAHIRRRAHSTKSSDSDSDSDMSSLSPSSLRTFLFPLPTYSHEEGPPSFLDFQSHSSRESLTTDPFNPLPPPPTTMTVRAPKAPKRQQRLLRRISQRLCHARLPPSPPTFPTTPTRPPRQEDEKSPDMSPSSESLLQTPTRTSFAHRLARQSLHFFTR